MICDKCKIAHHADCEGRTWCDCQHRQSAIHTNSIVNRDRSQFIETVARVYEIPKWMLGDTRPEEKTTEESQTQGG